MNKKAKGLIPPGLAYVAHNIISRQNMLGASKEIGAKWAKDLNLPKKAETIFFAGCGYQYTTGLESMISLIRRMDKSAIGAEVPMGLANLPKKMGIDLAGVYRKLSVKDSDFDGQPLRSAIKVLRNLGVDIGYLADDEPCCGGPLHYIGLEHEFAQNARMVSAKLKSHGVKRIISIVPSCTYTIRNLIPKYNKDHGIDVKHFSEQLARNLELMDEPRHILRAIKGIELVETDGTNREWATCCGGGGGFEVVFPELSEILAAKRTQELVETGAQIIVTHCPGCIMQLREGLKQLNISEVEVLDLAQVVATAMEV
jgi:Fe-S oxidoreductase